MVYHSGCHKFVIFTARKRSLRRLCFYRCVSVHRGGAYVAGGGGVCGGGERAWPGGMRGGGYGAGGRAWQIPRDTVNERAVRILLECILVYVPPKKLSFRLSFSLSDMTNYKSAFGKVCRIKNRHTFKSMPILNSAYFTECRRHIVIPCGKVCRIKNRHTFRILPILKSAYFKSMPIL